MGDGRMKLINKVKGVKVVMQREEGFIFAFLFFQKKIELEDLSKLEKENGGSCAVSPSVELWPGPSLRLKGELE